MRFAAIALLLAACSATPADDTSPKTYPFGPYTITAGRRSRRLRADHAEQRHRRVRERGRADDRPGLPPLELVLRSRAPTFAGDDGTFTCADRNFDQAVAALNGGVLFAQSTQASARDPGVPDRRRRPDPGALEARRADPPAQRRATPTLTLTPTITLTPIAEADVTTHARRRSRSRTTRSACRRSTQSSFTVECDLGRASTQMHGRRRRRRTSSIYYALAHYHTLGTGMTIEARRRRRHHDRAMFSTTTHDRRRARRHDRSARST